jgi:hypothetical protein
MSVTGLRASVRRMGDDHTRVNTSLVADDADLYTPNAVDAPRRSDAAGIVQEGALGLLCWDILVSPGEKRVKYQFRLPTVVGS